MFSEFEKKVITYCTDHSLFPSDKTTVVVAVSGGGDSIALLHVLDKIKDSLNLVVEAAHLNHSLRGRDSDEDELFCRNFCESRGIYLTVGKLPKGKIPASGESLETSARNERLAFLMQTAEKRKVKRIATGHTQDDVVETVLQRIFRGTGPSGLAGILPMRDNLWVRPLLGITRSEVRAYLKKEGMSYRDDASNMDTDFTRNRIRHEVIPLLQERFTPNVSAVIARLAELSRIQEEFLQKVVEEAFTTVTLFCNSYKILLDKSQFMQYHKVIKQRVVRHCLEILEGKGRNTDNDEIETILNIITQERGTIDITSSLRCGVSKSCMAFVKRTTPCEPVQLNIPGETIIPFGGGRIMAEQGSRESEVDDVVTVTLGSEIEKKFGSLTVGQVRRGEKIIPFGMKKSVRIRELMARTHLPEVIRDTLFVVRAGAVPVWIPGLQSSVYIQKFVGRQNTSDQNAAIILTYRNGLIMR